VKRVRGTFDSPAEFAQYQREQGLLDCLLKFMREIRSQGGERAILIQDPNGGEDVQIIIRRVRDITARGMTGVQV
jgi:hypothetical protein